MADLANASSAERIEAIKAGLPYSVFLELADDLAISSAQLTRIIQVAPRTLQRRKAAGTFEPDESDRLYRIVRLTARAREALGASGPHWLTTPKQAFGGKAPLELADTEIGAWEVTQALGRLEHGVFS